MNNKELYNIAKDAVREEELKGSDIPAIDLYVDQIINLVADKTQLSSERYHDKQLTKTMINNYSKDGLITPIKGKKYTKEQIVQILTVYTLKNTLSIGEIKRLLDGAYALDGFDGDALVKIYDRYIEIKTENREYSQSILKDLLESNSLNIEDERDFMLVVGSLLSLSGFLKNIAQALIDEKYPIPEEPEEKEEKEEKPKKDKAEKVKEKEEKERREREEKEEKERREREEKEKKKEKKKEEAKEKAVDNK